MHAPRRGLVVGREEHSAPNGGSCGSHSQLTLAPPNVEAEGQEGCHALGHGVEQDQEAQIAFQACISAEQQGLSSGAGASFSFLERE